MSAMVRNTRGFTLIEMIITIVVIGVGLAGILLVFQTVVKSSADPLVTKQLINIAEAQLEGEMLREFNDVTGGSCTMCPPGYTASINVASPTSDWESIPANKVKVVTVVVTHGTQTFELISYRTDYAP